MENLNLTTKVFLYTWIYAICLSPIFIVVSKFIDGNFNLYYLLGFILGVFVSLFSFSLIVKSTKRMMSKQRDAKIQSSYVSSYIVRLLVYGIVLFVAYKSDSLSWVTTAIGFFSVKIVIIIMTFFLKIDFSEQKTEDKSQKDGGFANK